MSISKQQMEIAARWWRERLIENKRIEVTEEQASCFENLLIEEIKQSSNYSLTLTNYSLTLTMDYHPCYKIRRALAGAGIKSFMNYFCIFSPAKIYMIFEEAGGVKVRETAYGEWFDVSAEAE